MLKKRGFFILTDHLLVFLLSIVLLLVVLNVSRTAVIAAFGSNLEQQFNNFMEELENLNDKSKQGFVILNSGTSIIGFSQDTDSFKCFNCGLGAEFTSFFKKPENNECGNSKEKKACVCLCAKPLEIDRTRKPYEMKCDRILCRTSKRDIIDYVELKHYVERYPPYPLKDAKWQGGFLYLRGKYSELEDFSLNGLPQQQGVRFTVFMQKDIINGKEYVAVCPHSKCIDIFKQQPQKAQQQSMPPNICQIIYKCFDSENVPKIGAFPEKYCKPDDAKAIQDTKENCEKVQRCVSTKVNLPSKCEQERGYYKLSISKAQEPITVTEITP